MKASRAGVRTLLTGGLSLGWARQARAVAPAPARAQIEADWFRQGEMDAPSQRAGHFNSAQEGELEQLRHPLAGLMN